MSKGTVYVSTLVCVTVMIVAAMVAWSGPLDPPAGQIAPTGRTMDEIYDAARGGSSASTPTAPAGGFVVVKITGQDQGVLTMDAGMIPGMPDSVQVFRFDHELSQGYDRATGLPTGKRQHKPFVITKEIDKASPLLAKAMSDGERLTVEIQFYNLNAAGGENYYSVVLTGASVVSARMHSEGLGLGSFTHQEEVMFSYTRIVWTYETGGLSHEDSWASPV